MLRITTKNVKLSVGVYAKIRHQLLPITFRCYSDKSKKPDSNADPDAPSTIKNEKQKTIADDKQKPSSPAVPKASKSRLNDLLAKMSTNSDLEIIKSVVTATPKVKKSSDSKKNTANKIKDENVKENVKNVATELGGDTKTTESELLLKLLKHRNDSTSTPGATNGEDIKLVDLIAGMKVDRNDDLRSKNIDRSFNKDQKESRSEFVRRRKGAASPMEDQQYPQQYQQQNQRNTNESNQFTRPQRNPKRSITDIEASKSIGSINLFGEKPLGIFTNVSEFQESSVDILKTWSRCEANELKLAVTHPPSNYFQKMALWTEQGKLWKFPIDNEQGLDDESKIYFTEHIFLDKHLEGWCPSKGPIRHFMELVCVGLSKNPYYTVQQKIDHILWFKQYFDEKKDILERVIIQKESPSSPSLTVETK